MTRSCPFAIFAITIAGFFMAGCSSTIYPSQPASSSILSPYQTRTPVHIPTLTLPATEPPTPTPTPIIYQVAAGDNLSAIARRFGVTLDALLAANPGVIPQALVVGQSLTIPTASTNVDLVYQFTPVPLQPGLAFCRPSGDGTICLIPVHNPYSQALENIMLRVTLLGEQGQPLITEDAVLPLNILPAGGVLPAAVFFSKHVTHPAAQAQLLTSMSLEDGDTRYLKTVLQNLLVSISWDGFTANVQGRILLLEDEKPATSLWLAAMAYDASGQIIGYRRWEWSGTLAPGASEAFVLPVYSLGPVIDHVEVLVEARP